MFNATATPAKEEPWSFLGTSPARRLIVEQAQRVAATDGTVLLIGRPGSGKDVLARDIHRHSPRAKGPFIALNCAAVTKELFEGELFGTMKGGFSGAIDRPGWFEQANGGTLFLDEIGEMSGELQKKLLRVIETRSVRRVGATGEERPVNVRIIAATNRNLERMVGLGTFRQDLWDRLSAVRWVRPDLGSADSRSLVPSLLDELARKGFGEVSTEEGLELCRRAEARAWPGNARQLRNALERYLTFRKPEKEVAENWSVVLQMEDASFDETGMMARPPSVAVAVAAPPAVTVETPEDAMQLGQHIADLIFLHIARQVLPTTGWGAWAELGRHTKMTGAGAQNRLKNLGIQVTPRVDLAQLDARIQSLGQLIAPMLPFLGTVLPL
jgi:transcriptional regulator with PAS, ATPase and Fis domain